MKNAELVPNIQEEETNSEAKELVIGNRDIYKGVASETQKEVGEIQAAKYETALYKLMSRTENNPELINQLNEFVDALDHQANFGDPNKALPKAREKDLKEFLAEATKALRWSVGKDERPANVKIDLQQWELNK